MLSLDKMELSSNEPKDNLKDILLKTGWKQVNENDTAFIKQIEQVTLTLIYLEDLEKIRVFFEREMNSPKLDLNMITKMLTELGIR